MGKKDKQSGKEVAPGKKEIVLDTNVLIHDPESIYNFDDNNVNISIVLIEELDEKKKGQGEVPYAARQALNTIDKLREGGNIIEGVKLPGGGLLKLTVNTNNYLSGKSNDNRIISLAIDIKRKNANVVLVSKDTAVRIKAASMGVVAEDYKKDKTTVFQKYGRVLGVNDDTNGIYSVRYQAVGGDIFRIRGKDESQQIRRRDYVSGIKPKNIAQECVIDALTNPEISVIALTGNAGSGKTLLALAAGLHQTMKSDPLYDQVLVARPTVPLSGSENEMGFFPGTVAEKINPWMQPIFDNLEVVMSAQRNLKSSGRKLPIECQDQEELIKKTGIKIEPLALIRGRSLPDKYFILDESQNMRPLGVKTAVTRCGEGTKIIFTGDLGQIDNPWLDSQSNGLAYLISRYINEPEFCYLHMTQSARSKMADKASRLL
jgi:PhoH-like ATPase